MPNHQGYYEGILELGKKIGLNDLNKPFNAIITQFQLLTTFIFICGMCMIVTSSLSEIHYRKTFKWIDH